MRWLPVFIMVVLSACQTTPQHIDPAQADLVRTIVQRHCVITTSGTMIRPDRQIEANAVSIFSITPRFESWYAADVSMRGVRGNLYFNTQTAQYICGSKNWQKFLDDPENKQPRVTSNIVATPQEARTVTVKWSGFDTPLIGVANASPSGKTGILSLENQEEDLDCTGRYVASGTWSLSCTNGMSASGSVGPYKTSKGISADGKDDKGNEISFEITSE